MLEIFNIKCYFRRRKDQLSPIAGTTIDPVDESFEYREKKLHSIDTAGLRRREEVLKELKTCFNEN